MAAMVSVMGSSNYSKTVLKNLSSPVFFHVETTSVPSGSGSSDDGEIHDQLSGEIFFVLIPIFLIMALAFFSGIVLACTQRRRRFDGLRHRLIPVYNFTTEDDEDSDEWGLLADQVENASNSRTNLDVIDLRP